jgi:hypothetical protein
MANALYDRGRQGFLAGEIDWDADNIKVALIDEGEDTPNLSADEDWADRSDDAKVAVSGNLANKTTTAGVADADDVTLTSVSGETVESIDIFQDTGTPATSLLIANIDTASGLPLTPDGGNVEITWDSGANKIFKL